MSGLRKVTLRRPSLLKSAHQTFDSRDHGVVCFSRESQEDNGSTDPGLTSQTQAPPHLIQRKVTSLSQPRVAAARAGRAALAIAPTSAAARTQRLMTLLLVLVVAAGIAVSGAPRAAAADQTITLKPVAATYDRGVSPDSNYAGWPTLIASQGAYRTFLKFDTSAISTQSIVSARLDLNVVKSTADASGFGVYTTASTWDPDTLTFNTRPASTSALLNPTESAVATAGSTVKTSLTGLVGNRLESRLSLAVTYEESGRVVEMSRTTMPTLTLTVRTGTATAAAPAASLAPVPYAAAAVDSSSKKVFAHWFPPYPVSIDNRPASVDYYARNYLNPAGENGKWQSVGGLLRDRPLGRDPVAGDYKMADAQTEVRQASSAGIDGFVTDIMSWGPSSESWNSSMRMVSAASAVNNGFVVAPMVDLTSANSTNVSSSTVASYLETFFQQSAAYRLDDGRYVVSFVKAESQPVSYYQDLMQALRADGVDVAFINVFMSLSDAQIKAYAPVSYGMGTWGVRSAELTRSFPNRAAAAHEYGVKWMSPIAVQDVRHKDYSAAESGNTDLLRASWERAIADGADMVQMITWNDYSESTSFAPSVNHGYSFLDINGYYATIFKRGSVQLAGDEVIVTHRIQKVGTQPAKQSKSITWTLGGSRTKPRDTVEVLCLCKSPATLSLTVAGKTTSFSAGAGVSAFTVPLSAGTVSAKAVRSGKTVATATSSHRVVDSVDYWDLQYYAASSRG